jgi:hypothetical protein
MISMLKSIVSGVLPFLILGLLAFGYIRGCAPGRSIVMGPVAQVVFGEGRIKNTPEQVEANSEKMIDFVHDLISEKVFNFKIDKDRLFLLKGSNGHFRIMGAFESKEDETVCFIIVLKDGEEIYREVGDSIVTGHYPEGVFPPGMYLK